MVLLWLQHLLTACQCGRLFPQDFHGGPGLRHCKRHRGKCGRIPVQRGNVASARVPRDTPRGGVPAGQVRGRLRCICARGGGKSGGGGSFRAEAAGSCGAGDRELVPQEMRVATSQQPSAGSAPPAPQPGLFSCRALLPSGMVTPNFRREVLEWVRAGSPKLRLTGTAFLSQVRPCREGAV